MQQGQVNITKYPALIDTGADQTSITAAVAQAQGLLPMGQMRVQSATQATMMNTYVADVVIDFGNMAHIISGLTLLEMHGGSANYQMLVGRDILCRGNFSMHFDGHFTFSL